MTAPAAILLLLVFAVLMWLAHRSMKNRKHDQGEQVEPAPKESPPTFSASVKLAAVVVGLLEVVALALAVLAAAEALGYHLNPGLFTYWGCWALVGLRRPDWILDPFTKALAALRRMFRINS